MKTKVNNKFKEISHLDDAYVIDDNYISYKRFKNINFKDDFNGITFTSCEFINCTFNNKIRNTTFFNSKIYKCELSNVMFESVGIHSCLIENSHMVGICFIDTTLNHIEFKDNNMELSNFSNSKFKECELIDNNLKSSSISEVSFDKVKLDNINFNDTEFINTYLKDLDLSNSSIEGIHINPEFIYGAIVNEVQAIELVALLGVIIK